MSFVLYFKISKKIFFMFLFPSLSLSVQKKNDYCLLALSTPGKVAPLDRTCFCQIKRDDKLKSF